MLSSTFKAVDKHFKANCATETTATTIDIDLLYLLLEIETDKLRLEVKLQFIKGALEFLILT